MGTCAYERTFRRVITLATRLMVTNIYGYEIRDSDAFDREGISAMGRGERLRQATLELRACVATTGLCPPANDAS
jgi:hypothetical protein